MTQADSLPLVSCIMPTANRRAYVPLAIRCFLSQDYPHKELLIVDDGADRVADLVPAHPQVRYEALAGSRSLGAKRNACVEMSRGALIAHWDDDDWSAPFRLSRQVKALLAARAEVCSLRQMLFYQASNGRTWLYTYPVGRSDWLAGGSLLYTRAFWQRSPFPNLQIGEDTRFVMGRRLERAVAMPDYTFYVALIHPGNTSPKTLNGSYWSPWPGDLAQLMGEDFACFSRLAEQAPSRPPASAAGSRPSRPIRRPLSGRPRPPVQRARTPAQPAAPPNPPPTPEEGQSEQRPSVHILMAVHNALAMLKFSILRTLRHSAGQDARLVVIDNGSSDGSQTWLDLLARRGDILLLRRPDNPGHGPALEYARAYLAQHNLLAPYLVTLDSDAFPLADGWLAHLRGLLTEPVRAAGIRHHRNYIHPSCLMVASRTLDELGVTLLNEKDRPSRYDVAERLSVEILKHGGQIAGLERTRDFGRGSKSEPVYLGSVYQDLVYHHWYTTRAASAGGPGVDDVPAAAIAQAWQRLEQQEHSAPREVTVIIGARARPDQPRRLRNLLASLRALNLQDLERWRYRLVVIEQDAQPRLREQVAPYVDLYQFVYNPGPYNRGWGFNVGAVLPGSQGSALCLFDADLLPPPAFLREGLNRLQAGAKALQPYTRVLYLDRPGTERALADAAQGPGKLRPAGQYSGQGYDTSQGGCLWVRQDLYLAIGGHDERFEGWGSEDREFWQRLARAAPIERLPGSLLHLEHELPAMSDPLAQANYTLLAKIQRGQAGPPAARIGDPQRYTAKSQLPTDPSGRSIPINGSGMKTSTSKPQPRARVRSDLLPQAAAEPPAKDLTQPVLAPPKLPTQTERASGERSWQNWDLWQFERILRIVQDERRLPPALSARASLAAVVAGLGSRVLDVGCGPGALWVRFQQHPHLSWTGADVTARMTQAARQLSPTTPVVQADSGDLPFANGSYEVVVLRHVLEHLPEWLARRALCEATRVASRAVVIAFYLKPAARGSRQSSRVGENFIETRWTVKEIQSFIEETGWRLTRRQALPGRPEEQDEAWVLAPPVTEPARDEAGEDEAVEIGPNPLVSIIMPTYRRSQVIRRTVGTILKQTYSNWELIIVDNDGSLNQRFNDPRIRVFRHAEIASASYARNQGLSHARGELVCFFDDDDDMFPHYLERFVTAFRANPRAKMVRCGMFVSENKVNYTYATPECCLRRAYATPTWTTEGPGQDQKYFYRIVTRHRWNEARGDIVMLSEALCRANAHPVGGLRSGRY